MHLSPVHLPMKHAILLVALLAVLLAVAHARTAPTKAQVPDSAYSSVFKSGTGFYRIKSQSRDDSGKFHVSSTFYSAIRVTLPAMTDVIAP